MDAPNTPPGFSHRVTPAAALVEHWRRNGGRSGNVSSQGDEAAAESVVSAVSVVPRPRVEMPVPSATFPLNQRPTPIPFRNEWTPLFNPRGLNLGCGGAAAAETLFPMFQGLNLSGVQGGMENTTNSSFSRDAPVYPSVPSNLPQPSRFLVASAPHTSYMIHGFPNYVASPCTITGGDSGSSSSSSSVRLTDEEALVFQNPMGSQLLYHDQRRSGYQEQRGVHERAMNRGELALLLRLLKENTYAESTNDVVRVICSRDVYFTMADEFGSQLFVALLDACNGRQMSALVRTVTSDGVQLTKVAAKTNFGVNCIKKVFEKVKKSPLFSRRVANALAKGAYHLMTADNGRDVLKHCFKHLSYDRASVLLNAAVEGFMNYARDVKGCGNLKYCISQAQGPLRRLMMGLVATNALQLATHYYGNYVVQHVIEIEESEDVKESIFLTMTTNFVQVATNKCGSFVLEKFLYTPQFGTRLCGVIARHSLSRPEELEQIARDQHGNYVLQEALAVSAGGAPEVHSLLVRAIAGLSRSLMTDPHANKLYKTALRNLQSCQ